MRARLARTGVSVSALVWAVSAALSPSVSWANTFHHESGGGSSSTTDPDADCLRWEAVYVSSDGAVSDRVEGDLPGAGGAAGGAGGAAGAGGGGGEGAESNGGAAGGGGAGGTSPAGPDAGATGQGALSLRCVEHATLFGCRCALGARGAASASDGAAVALAVMVAAAALGLCAGRRRRSNLPRSLRCARDLRSGRGGP